MDLGITGAMAISKNSTAHIQITGAGSLIDGKDYLPQDPPTLNPSGVAVDGIASSLSTDLDLSGTNGGIPILGKRAVPTKDTVALGSIQPDWNALPGQLIPKATRVVTSAPGAAQTWGTWSSPEITYLNGSWGCSKPITGCGILIVEPSAGGTISFSQTLGWTGLILIKGNAGGATFKVTNVNTFYGAILFAGPPSLWQQNNNGLYHYSSLAIKQIVTMLLQSSGSSGSYAMTNRTWKEF
jgi:hypothetical protein